MAQPRHSHWSIALNRSQALFVCSGLGQPLLRPGVVSLHLGEHPFHIAQDPNRFDGAIWVSVAFKFGDQLTLPLNAEALVNDVPFPKFDRVFAASAGFGMH